MKRTFGRFSFRSSIEKGCWIVYNNATNCGVRLRWLGCACFELDFGSATVVIDPWITANQRTGLTWKVVEKCDCIALTHGHFDHILDIPALAKKFHPRILCAENTAVPLMKWADLNPMTVYPMHPNLVLDLDSTRIKALFGRHGVLPGTVNERMESIKTHSIVGEDSLLRELFFWGDIEYRNYLFTMPNGTKILFWGNPLHLPEHRNALIKEKPDILILQATDKRIPETAAKLCAQIGCTAVIPHHMDFPGDYCHIVDALGKELAQVAPQTQYIVPAYGRWLSL